MFLDCKLPRTNAPKRFSGLEDVKNSTLYGATGRLKCDTGYKLEGSNYTNADTEVNITCTKDGTWSTEAISCVKKGRNLKSMFAYFNILALNH